MIDFCFVYFIHLFMLNYWSALQNKMILKTIIKPADLLIVFGTTYKLDLFAQNILKLYDEKYCKYILCTGGAKVTYNGKTTCESILMKSLLLNNNQINSNHILTENKSKNTGENLQFSIPILETFFGKIENIKSIIGLGKNFATRRFLMTMCKYFPSSEKMFYPINVFDCDENNLIFNEKFCDKIKLEEIKCEEYLKNGFISELDDKVLLI